MSRSLTSACQDQSKATSAVTTKFWVRELSVTMRHFLKLVLNEWISIFLWFIKFLYIGIISLLPTDKSRVVPFRSMPPEFFRQRRYSLKSDVWSYGILLWEVMSGGGVPYGVSKDCLLHLNNQIIKLFNSQRLHEILNYLRCSTWRRVKFGPASLPERLSTQAFSICGLSFWIILW